MSSLLREYTTLLQNNQAAVSQLEGLLRSCILIFSDARNVLQFEAGMAVANSVAFMNKQLLATTTSSSDDTGCGGIMRAAYRMHHLLCEFQTVIELLARRRLFPRAPRQANRVVVGIEAAKSLLILASRWEAFVFTCRRAKATLLAPSACPSQNPSGVALLEPSTNSGPRVIVPRVAGAEVDLTTGTLAPPRFTSWREWVLFVVDVLYLLRPALYAYTTLRPWRYALKPAQGAAGAGLSALTNITTATRRRAAWRGWALGVLVEVVLVLLTIAARVGAPPIVVDCAPGDGNDRSASSDPTETLLGQRVRSVMLHLQRNPFFGRYLRRPIERYIVRGWFARNVPLLGGVLAYQVQRYLALQRESFLYTAGGAQSAVATTVFV